MSERIEALLALADKYPELTAVLVATVVWPTITGIVSFAQDGIKARAPRLWSVLKSSGFDALGTIRKVWPKRLPPPPPAAVLLLVLAAPSLTGCGASLQEAADALTAANTIATEAQPCLVAEKQREAVACNGDATCEATVTARWAPVADAYDALHRGWCALAPDAAGCP